MKANEAPERLYLSKTIYSTYLYQVPYPDDETAVEYTRTDAFIDKALKWYCLDCECNNNCKDTKCFFYREFERYLNGADNCLPPKFTYTILNEDGSVSENWQYRHFTNKMQNAFIEKACEFLKDHLAGYDICEDDIERSVESFKLAIKL